MSQLKLSGDASGTGIVTVAAPNTNSTYTVTLPAAAGTIVTGAAGSNTQVQYNNAGAFGGITNATTDGTTLSMTSPKVITSINDTNGNELFKLTATGSAVNEVTVANAATGNNPVLSATGNDTDIGINLTPKGSGAIKLSGLSYPTADGSANQAIVTNGSGTLSFASISAAAATPTTLGTVYGKTDSGSPYSSFFGYQAGNSTTASSNVGVGYQSLFTNSTGTGNAALGVYSLYSNTTGNYNTAVGSGVQGSVFGPLHNNSSGSNNIAVGTGALYSNTTASNNTAIGYQALFNNTASNNVAVGYNALYAKTSGADNTAVGYQAGDVITTGTGNVIIGKNADPSVSTSVDQIVIGNGVTGQANTNVTIGNATGKIYNAYTITATWSQTSDGTMKNVIGPDSLGLSFINRLNPILFTWKAQNDLPPDHPYYAEENKRDTTRVIHGFVAQEVKAALDAEGCSTFNGWDQGDDGIQAISREMFISPLVKAVQELSAQVQALQAEIATLKGN